MKIDRIKAEIDVFKHIANSFSIFFLATATGLINKWQTLSGLLKVSGMVVALVLAFCIVFFKIMLILHAKLLEKL